MEKDSSIDTQNEGDVIGEGFRSTARIPKTAELVADDIRKRIVRGQLKEGDYLPLEGELKVTLGISRPTLREAFRILEAEKLISVVRGSRTGARVHAPKAKAVSRYAGFVLQSQGTPVRDIYEARLAVEPFIARNLAAQRDTAAADALQEEADRLTVMVNEERYIDFMIGLVEFHRLLVERGGNRTLQLVTEMLQDVTANYQVERLRRHPIDHDTQRRRALWGIRSFQKLIALIREGDAEGAEHHWRLHVINSNASWIAPEDQDYQIDVL